MNGNRCWADTSVSSAVIFWEHFQQTNVFQCVTNSAEALPLRVHPAQPEQGTIRLSRGDVLWLLRVQTSSQLSGSSGETWVAAGCLGRRKRPPSRISFTTRRRISQEVAQRLLLRMFHYRDAFAAASVHLLPDTNLSGEGLSCFIAEYCRRWNIQFHTVAMSLNSAWVVDLETLACASGGIFMSVCFSVKGKRAKNTCF